MSFLKEVLRGIAIGVANIIPGVSGGTMMVSMGIYGDVIGAVTGMPKHFWKSVKFLLPYAIGMLIGIGGLSFAIGYFFLEFPFETAMLFIGLIFGGVPLLLPKIMGKRITFSETLLFVLFFGLVVWMQFWKQGTDVALEPGIKNSISLFVVGTVAAATMVIPGVSGSMLLMSLGYYTPIINRISGFLAALPALKWEELFACAAVLIPFGIGVVLGIFIEETGEENVFCNYGAGHFIADCSVIRDEYRFYRFWTAAAWNITLYWRFFYCKHTWKIK